MLTLYQFSACPFCGKVRAFLHHQSIPFDSVEVSPFGMKELDFTEHKKVPVLKDGEQIIVESAAIVQHLQDHYSELKAAEGAETWAQWIDNTLVHYLPPLLHPDFSTSWKNFARILPAEQLAGFKGLITRFGGAIMMPKVARKMKARHDIEDAEAGLAEAIDHWVDAGLAGKAFFGGEQADLVDTSVFGVLHSVDGLGILEPHFTRNERFGRWYQQCKTTKSKG